jgi:hypothetical protein
LDDLFAPPPNTLRDPASGLHPRSFCRKPRHAVGRAAARLTLFGSRRPECWRDLGNGARWQDPGLRPEPHRETKMQQLSSLGNPGPNKIPRDCCPGDSMTCTIAAVECRRNAVALPISHATWICKVRSWHRKHGNLQSVRRPDTHEPRHITGRTLRGGPHPCPKTLFPLPRDTWCNAGLGHGLAVYKPRTRLTPTGNLCLDPAFAHERPLLIIDADEGPTGLSRCSFLFRRDGANLRGVMMRDAAHRLHNNFDLCVKKAGLHSFRLRYVAYVPCVCKQCLDARRTVKICGVPCGPPSVARQCASGFRGVSCCASVQTLPKLTGGGGPPTEGVPRHT